MRISRRGFHNIFVSIPHILINIQRSFIGFLNPPFHNHGLYVTSYLEPLIISAIGLHEWYLMEISSLPEEKIKNNGTIVHLGVRTRI